MCVVADDTNVYILLLFVGNQFMSQVYFRQGICGITYHEIITLAEYLDDSVCSIHPPSMYLQGAIIQLLFLVEQNLPVSKKCLLVRKQFNS